MSATDTMADWGSEFDERDALLWSHDSQATPPDGSYKDRFFHYVKRRCQEAGSWRLDTFGQLHSDFCSELAGG